MTIETLNSFLLFCWKLCYLWKPEAQSAYPESNVLCYNAVICFLFLVMFQLYNYWFPVSVYVHSYTYERTYERKCMIWEHHIAKHTQCGLKFEKEVGYKRENSSLCYFEVIVFSSLEWNTAGTPDTILSPSLSLWFMDLSLSLPLNSWIYLWTLFLLLKPSSSHLS